MERRGSQPRNEHKKMRGARALAASGLIVVSGALAACGSSNATENPTQVPSQPAESPTPTLVVSPSVEPSASPSVVPSASPSVVEASPSPAGSFNAESFLKDLEAGGHALDQYRTPISLPDLQTAYNNLMASTAVPKNNNFPAQFSYCIDSKNPMDLRLTDCISVTGWGLRSIHNFPQSQEAEAFGLAMARYDIVNIYKTQQQLSLLTQGVKNEIANF